MTDDRGAKPCELCRAERITSWFYEDERCWIAQCEICEVPMVVWRRHGASPPTAEHAHMLERLNEVARGLYGEGEYYIDPVMRQIPDHFHAHARDNNWWARRFGRA